MMNKLLVFGSITLVADLALALPNPAALYCERLGYDYRIVETPQGAKGVVTVEPGVEFDEWDFFKGKVGNEYSYGALHGYDTECVRKDMGRYVAEYAVCISREGKKAAEGIPLLELMEQNGEPLIDPVLYESGKHSTHPDDTDDKEQETEPYIMTRVAREALPSTFDWRSKDGHSYIGSVHNQGVCGSCYAFGAAAAAEGTYNWAMGKYDGDCADFSESYIIWCLGRLASYSNDFYGCDGASYAYAELTALCTEGVGNESDYPYTVTDPGSCTHWGDTTTAFASWGRIDCGDVDAIKTAITNYGIVDAAVYVELGGPFQNYTSGVFEDTRTNCYSSPCYYTPVNHAIALVGWDDSPAEGGGGCWILRNSWGTWGESGYMRIRYTSARVACEACYLTYDTNTHTLAVTSEHGNANPAAGVHTMTHGRQVTCQVTNSPVCSGSTNYTCVGWTGSGSVPASGTSTNTGAFSFTNDSTITWLWQTNVLSAPTGVSASDGTYTDKIQVTWSSVTGATSYEVWRNTGNSSGSATNLATALTTSYDDLSAVVGQSFYYWVKAKNSITTSAFSSSDLGYVGTSVTVFNDYDGDGKSDLAIFDNNGGYWYVISAADSVIVWAQQWGWSGVVPVPGDYDNDGISDMAVFDGNTGYWYIRTVSGTVLGWSVPWGWPGAVPVWGDYNADGASDLAVFDSNTGYWYVYSLSGSVIAWAVGWGWPGAVPVSGDYDGDGVSDIAVFDSNTGYWYVYSLSGSVIAWAVGWGWPGAVPVSGDYDGDGVSDTAVFDSNTGYWYVYSLSGSVIAWAVSWGWPGAVPVSGDYDGDGVSDTAIFDSNTGCWYIYSLSGNVITWQKAWGWSGTTPVGSLQ